MRIKRASLRKIKGRLSALTIIKKATKQRNISSQRKKESLRAIAIKRGLRYQAICYNQFISRLAGRGLRGQALVR
jgi:hypothetical protein